MSLSEILGTAISGLAASQAGLRTVSTNIANVGTAGYARQKVSQATSVTAGRVTGVLTGEPERIADRFLEANAWRRSGDVGRADAAASYLDRLQALLGAPGAESGLAGRIDAIGTAAIALSASQNSSQTSAAFVGNVEDALNVMRQLDRDVGAIRADAQSEVVDTVDRINGLLVRIHDLNAGVAQMKGQGRSAAGAEDQRMLALDELSTLVKVQIRTQPDGRINIETATGAMLLDGKLRQLSFPAGEGAAQPLYPDIDIRFAGPNGSVGPATGETIASAAAGGTLGGLLEMRDGTLPAFADRLGTLFSGLARSLNAASNAGTAVPAPQTLAGRQTGLIGSDRLGFTGRAAFAVTAADGTLVARTEIDLATVASVDDAVAAINTGLGGAATASFSNGRLTIAAGSGKGIVVAQDPAAPAARAASGFAQFFGLNDIVRSADSTLVPMGFVAGDQHGFATGQTAEVLLRDADGRMLARHTLTPASGGTMGDLLAELNASPIGSFGTMSLDSLGRFAFTPIAALPGAGISFASDATDRFGTGLGLAALSGVSGRASGLVSAEVRPDLSTSPDRLPLARLQSVAVGAKALGAGDLSGALGFADALAAALDLGREGRVTTSNLSTRLVGTTGAAAARASDSLTDARGRHDDAVNRRDSVSGVNIDEELAQMVVFQNSYGAAARVITTAGEMYDTLLGMVR